ncbi:lipopolysaccharide biosynthesis protein [Pseudomonas sp. BF-R-19]|uniref:lipopolysaccharide biosynthesis protein n=1 Tax=Pseudomonas sp. BF-R-19 TaxID=2832397 RepID=UPI001CC1A3BF|nr:oligosaccharide flippase family protein [Pseudomonas sp. BF-R-19]
MLDRALGKLFKNTGMLTSANLLASAAAFVIIPIFIRKLGYADFGVLTLVQTITLIAIALTNFQVWQPISRQLSEGCENKDEYLLTGFLLEYTGTIISLALGLSTAIFLLLILKLDGIIFLWLIPCALTIISSPSGTLLSNLRAENKYTTIAIYTLLPAGIKLILALSLTVHSILDALWINALGDSVKIAFIAATFFSVRKARCRPLNLLFTQSKWGWLAQIADLPVIYLDRLLVGAIFGLELLSLYHIMKRISGVFLQFAGPIYQILYPEMLNDIKNNGLNCALERSYKLGIILFVAGTLGLLILYMTSQYWLHYFITNEVANKGYEDYIFCFLAIQTLVASFIFIHPLLLAVGGYKQTMIITFTSNIIFVASILLMSTFGMWGLIAANSVQYVFSIAPKFALIYKEKKGVQHDS